MPRKDKFAILCSIPDCGRPMRARALCATHWKRWRDHGDANADAPVAPTTAPLEDRFWAKVIKNDDGCWGWTGGTAKFGYGSIRDWKDGNRLWLAHRLSWTLHNGAIPQGMAVLHRCDNPPCNRPDHLFLGTKADNVADMIAKGRERHIGNANPHPWKAKFTEDHVREIRQRRAAGESYTTISLGMLIPVGTVRQIASRQTWKHVT